MASIWAAQELVKYGLRWRIGNEESVKVWGDKWVPTSTTFQITSPMLFMHPDRRVRELINKEEACCKLEVIKALFLPQEAEVIRGIHISPRLPEDKQFGL